MWHQSVHILIGKWHLVLKIRVDTFLYRVLCSPTELLEVKSTVWPVWFLWWYVLICSLQSCGCYVYRTSTELRSLELRNLKHMQNYCKCHLMETMLSGHSEQKLAVPSLTCSRDSPFLNMCLLVLKVEHIFQQFDSLSTLAEICLTQNMSPLYHMIFRKFEPSEIWD